MYPFFTLSYWTSLLPPPVFDPLFLAVIFGFFCACFLASIVLYVFSRRLKKYAFWAKGAPKLATMFLWMGVFGLIHLWIAYEQVYLWGARFWLLVWVLVLLAWLGYILRYVIKILPRIEAEYEEKMRIAKYLPHK